MIKHLTLLGTALLFSSQILLAQWKPAGDKIRTFWAEKGARVKTCVFVCYFLL